VKGVLPLTAVLLTVGAQPAAAAFPGTNGLIAMERQSRGGIAIATVNGDGTGDRAGVIATGAENRDPSWAPDGRRLASGGDDGTARVWDPDDPGHPAVTLTGHAGSVWSVAWSPDGRRLAIRARLPGSHTKVFLLSAEGGVPQPLV